MSVGRHVKFATSHRERRDIRHRKLLGLPQFINHREQHQCPQHLPHPTGAEGLEKWWAERCIKRYCILYPYEYMYRRLEEKTTLFCCLTMNQLHLQTIINIFPDLNPGPRTLGSGSLPMSEQEDGKKTDPKQGDKESSSRGFIMYVHMYV